MWPVPRRPVYFIITSVKLNEVWYHHVEQHWWLLQSGLISGPTRLLPGGNSFSTRFQIHLRTSLKTPGTLEGVDLRPSWTTQWRRDNVQARLIIMVVGGRDPNSAPSRRQHIRWAADFPWAQFIPGGKMTTNWEKIFVVTVLPWLSVPLIKLYR